jgi:hypothetical protein
MILNSNIVVLLSGAWYAWNYILKEIKTRCILIQSPVMSKSRTHTMSELNEEPTSNMRYIILSSILLLAVIKIFMHT